MSGSTADNFRYDLIGDIHGEAPSLKTLLKKLGYEDSGHNSFAHPTRTVIFLGDFVDRGPYQRETIEIARNMCSAGTARAVMGNHEFNAIAFATKIDGRYLRDRSWKNIKQHLDFLWEFDNDIDEYRNTIDWCKSLPLYLDLNKSRVVHACWDQHFIDKLNTEYSGPVLTDDLLTAACDRTTWEYQAIETLLKGKEVPLPDGHSFLDKDKNPRHHIRIKWWEQTATTYKEAFLGPDNVVSKIPDTPINTDLLAGYAETEPPVFIGHYWLEGTPYLLAPNICCLDFSVAKKLKKGPPSGKLCAYRWDGEQRLQANKFVYVDRISS